MKKILSCLGAITVAFASVSGVVSCSEINYERLPKDLSLWKIDSYGLFNNEIGVKLLLSNNTSDSMTAIYYYDKDKDKSEDLNHIYQDCYDKGASATSPECYINADHVVKSFIYYYELKTKKDLSNSLVALNAKHNPDMKASFAKITSNLDITISSDEKDNLVQIKDNSNNTPGYFSFYLAFGVSIKAADKAPDGYKNAIVSSKGTKTVPVLISFQEGF